MSLTKLQLVSLVCPYRKLQ